MHPGSPEHKQTQANPNSELTPGCCCTLQKLWPWGDPTGAFCSAKLFKTFHLGDCGFTTPPFKAAHRRNLQHRWDNTDKYLLNRRCYWNQSTVEFQAYKKSSRNSTRFIQRWLHSNSLFRILLSHSLEKKKLGLFLSFIPPPYWVFPVAFSTLIAVTWEEQMQPTDGLNHPSFPVAFIVFFTAE